MLRSPRFHRFIASSVSALLAANSMVLVVGLADDIADDAEPSTELVVITNPDGSQTVVDPTTPEGWRAIDEANRRGSTIEPAPSGSLPPTASTTTVRSETTTTLLPDVGSTVTTLLDTVDSIVRDAEDLVDDTVRDTTDDVDDVVDDVTDVVDDTTGGDTDHVDDAVDRTTDTVADDVDRTTDTVVDADDLLDDVVKDVIGAASDDDAVDDATGTVGVLVP